MRSSIPPSSLTEGRVRNVLNMQTFSVCRRMGAGSQCEGSKGESGRSCFSNLLLLFSCSGHLDGDAANYRSKFKHFMRWL